MMDHNGKNLLFSGVGGQGVLLASELVARTALHAGFDAKKTELHGAAQRGGSVISHVRFAEKVFSPLCTAGEVDILLGMEKLEGLRWAHLVKEGGTVILNDEERVPAKLDANPVVYPKDVEGFLTSKGFNVILVNATEIAKTVGNFRAANTVLLGAMAELTEISSDHWIAVMKESLHPKILDVNLLAFEEGRAITQSKVHRPTV